MCWRTDLICEGLPSCERAHVRVLLGCQLGLTVCGQRSHGSPFRQHAAISASCLCNTTHLPEAYAPRLLVGTLEPRVCSWLHAPYAALHRHPHTGKTAALLRACPPEDYRLTRTRGNCVAE